MKQKLTEEGLKNALFDLYECLNYSNKAPADRIRFWQNKLYRFTDEQVWKACERMQDDLDALPRNVPKAIKAAIVNLYGAEERQWIDYGQCDSCQKSGGFCVLVKNKVTQHWQEKIIFCSECENWRNVSGKTAYEQSHTSKSELEAKRIIHVRLNQPVISWRRLTGKVPQPERQTGKTTDDVQALATKIAKPI
jgi:hypothetical protein